MLHTAQVSHYTVLWLVFCFFRFSDVRAESYSYRIISRLYNTPDGYDKSLLCRHIEQQYRVGPLELNREAVIRTQTNLRTNKRIFTDNNGYQMQIRDFKTYDNNTVARVCTWEKRIVCQPCLLYMIACLSEKSTKPWNFGAILTVYKRSMCRNSDAEKNVCLSL